MDFQFHEEWNIERLRTISALETEWRDNRKSQKRWEIIRRAYGMQMPDILSRRAISVRARTTPYFLDWDFTPIEFAAWAAIRQFGLPFYPQVPAANFFLDFGDPYFKIGIELDGKDYHECGRDTRRDRELWRHGWRIFRIAGKSTMPLRIDEEIIEGFDPDISDENFDEWMYCTEEGIIWAIGLVYYGLRARNSNHLWTAEYTLRSHRYIEFPLYLGDSDGED